MKDSLYEKLGAENLQTMVNTFYDLVQQDERINHLFQTDMDLVKHKQLSFLTQFLGGEPLYNQQYGHPRMRLRHMPHKITPAAAEAWLENMKKAVDSLPIEQQMKDAVFSAFPRLATHMVNS